MTSARTNRENICDECGLPISICNAKAMFEQAARRNGRDAVIAAILDAQTEQPAPDAVAGLMEADTPRAWADVLDERKRQVAVVGWTPEDDDCYLMAELAQAAACYAISGTPADEARYIHGRWKDHRDLFWPFARDWWKPTDRRRNLVKAGALILAEIERLDRAALAQERDQP